jgi:hypothetical protein
MRKVGIAVAVVVLLTFGAVALASGDATEPSAGRGSGNVIKLSATLAQIKLLDLGDAGFSLGDESVFTDDLLTRKDGKKVGFTGGVCTVVRVADAAMQSGTVQCLVTFTLKGGQITTQGFNTVTNLAITGTQVSAVGRHRPVPQGPRRGDHQVPRLRGGERDAHDPQVNPGDAGPDSAPRPQPLSGVADRVAPGPAITRRSRPFGRRWRTSMRQCVSSAPARLAPPESSRCTDSRRVSRKAGSCCCVSRRLPPALGLAVSASGAIASGDRSGDRRRSGGREPVSVEFQQVVGGCQQPPFRSDG